MSEFEDLLKVRSGKFQDEGRVRLVGTKKKSAGKNSKRFVVVHYTAHDNFEGDVKQLSTADAKVSCHLVIGRDGEITQIGSFDDILWHAGPSKWKGVNGLNSHSIGIELTNPGYMDITSNAYVTWYGKRYLKSNTPDSFVEAKHPSVGSATKGWLRYSRKQIEALIHVVASLKKAYPSIEEVVGHEQISPGRKQDPGLGIIFDWKLLDELNGIRSSNESSEEFDIPSYTFEIVNAPKGLRVRSGPTTSSAVIGSLKTGDIVEGYDGIGDGITGFIPLVDGGYISSAYAKQLR